MVCSEPARRKSELKRTQEDRGIVRKPGRGLRPLLGRATAAVAKQANQPLLYVAIIEQKSSGIAYEAAKRPTSPKCGAEMKRRDRSSYFVLRYE